jgi:hypothetical protein
VLTFKDFLVAESSYAYKNKSALMLLKDFYAISALNKEVTRSTTQIFQDDQTKIEIESIVADFVPKFKCEILWAVFISIISESRHIFDSYRNYAKIWEFYIYLRNWKENNPIHMAYVLPPPNQGSTLDPDYIISGEKSYSKSFFAKSPFIDGTDLKAQTYLAHYLNRLQNSSTPYDNKFYDAFSQFVKTVEPIFSENRFWLGLYGGSAWAEICRNWSDLYNTSDNKIDELIVKIDHIIDLEHNTGNVLNKSWKWDSSDVKSYLNIKRYETSLPKLIDDASPRLKQTLNKILHAKNRGDRRFPYGMNDQEIFKI